MLTRSSRPISGSIWLWRCRLSRATERVYRPLTYRITLAPWDTRGYAESYIRLHRALESMRPKYLITPGVRFGSRAPAWRPFLSIVAFYPVGPLAAMCCTGRVVAASFSGPASPTRNICYAATTQLDDSDPPRCRARRCRSASIRFRNRHSQRKSDAHLSIRSSRRNGKGRGWDCRLRGRSSKATEAPSGPRIASAARCFASHCHWSVRDGTKTRSLRSNIEQK
jgi:hypothetical protein